MKKVVLVSVMAMFLLVGLQIANSQTVTEEQLREGKVVSSSPESLQPRGELIRKDSKTTVECEATELPEQQAELIQDLRKAKKAGDATAVKAIEKQLGWTKGPKPKSTSPPPQRVIRESANGGDERFATDILVSNPAYSSIRPAMASRADGTLFVVDEDAGANYLDIYKSTDDGQTWSYITSLFSSTCDFTNPSIAVGEGNENWLLIAFELVCADASHIYVYRENLDTGDSEFILVASSAPGYLKYPQICVDSPEYSMWYPYITYATGIIGAKQDWWDVYFQRSTDYGANWSTPTTIASNLSLCKPDIDFGYDNLYVTYEDLYGPDDHDVFVRRSTSLGNTWDPVVTLGSTYDDEYDPRVAATNDGGAVVVAYTRWINNTEDKDIQLYYSTDSGDTWYWSGLPWTYDDELTVDLDVSYSYGKIHAAFWRNYDIHYTFADYSDPSSWQPATLVNEDNWASGVYTRPTIAVNPTKTEEAGIAWTDLRFGSPYRVYFDAAYIPESEPCPPPPDCPPGPRKWTFMVYLDGDNNLEGAGIDDFLEMAQVGTTCDVNIVVQFDRIDGYDSSYDDWTMCHRFYVTQGMKPYEQCAIPDWGDASGGREVNMGDPQTLIDFTEWAMTNYPADNYALVLWNHGNGWREVMEARDLFPLKAVCWDDSSAGDCLFMKEVGDALGTIENDIEQVDLVGFDVCLNGMAEVAYEIKDHGSVMVGSEETEPGDGWPYDTILPDLTANPTMSPADLACVIVNRYGEFYGAGSGTTQSAFDLANMSSLAEAISNFGNLMVGSAYKSEIATCRASSQQYYYPEHIDLYHFADLVSTGVPNAPIQSAADSVKTRINNTVLCEFHGSLRPNSHGAAIYFPNCPSHSFNTDYNSSVIDFASDTYWDQFLGWYCGVPVPMPDLVVLSITTDPTEPTEGQLVNVDVTVKNQGSDDAAGSFYIDWYHHLDTSPSTNQAGDQYKYVSSLAAGATHTMSTTYTYSTAGDYNMWAQVDTEKQVPESDEDNNVLGPQVIHVTTGVIPGDANGDGVVDVSDIDYVVDIIFGIQPPTPGADCNQDGVVDVSDIDCIVDIIFGG